MSAIRHPYGLCSLVILMVFAAGCKQDKGELAAYHPVLQSVLRYDKGTFRGLNLGSSLDTVKSAEPAQPVEVDQDYLYYEYATDDSSATYSIAYDFDESGLVEIQSEVFVKDPEQTDSILGNFKRYFSSHFGPPQDHMGFFVWTVNSSEYGTVRINLNDESTDLAAEGSPGKISLWIYPDKE